MVNMPKRVLEAHTQEGRAKQRKQLGTLRSLTVQPITRARYQAARDQFYEWLRQENLFLPHSTFRLDLVVSDYLEHLWATGHGRTDGSNLLAGLQDLQPHLKGKLKSSWRLMKTWVTHEVPNRAPPLSIDALNLLVGYCLFKGQSVFALSLLLGFHGLLRTGELLNVAAKHIAIARPKGPAVISLGLTKAGKRQGAAESVTIHNEDVCRRLHQWKQNVSASTSLTGPSHKWRKQFADTLEAVNLHTLQYRPYSLRRGGATHYFNLFGSLDKLLLLGRWQAATTARIYLNEGLSVLTELKIPWTPFSRNLRNQYNRSLTQPLPKLEFTKQASQARGRWKKKPKKEVIWTRVCLNQSFSRVERIRCLGCGRTLVLPLNTIQGFLREWPRCVGSIKYFVNLRIFYLGKRSLIILIWQLRTCRAKQKFGRHCETLVKRPRV